MDEVKKSGALTDYGPAAEDVMDEEPRPPHVGDVEGPLLDDVSPVAAVPSRRERSKGKRPVRFASELAYYTKPGPGLMNE